jgi:hypothetical protein
MERYNINKMIEFVNINELEKHKEIINETDPKKILEASVEENETKSNILAKENEPDINDKLFLHLEESSDIIHPKHHKLMKLTKNLQKEKKCIYMIGKLIKFRSQINIIIDKCIYSYRLDKNGCQRELLNSERYLKDELGFIVNWVHRIIKDYHRLVKEENQNAEMEPHNDIIYEEDTKAMVRNKLIHEQDHLGNISSAPHNYMDQNFFSDEACSSQVSSPSFSDECISDNEIMGENPNPEINIEDWLFQNNQTFYDKNKNTSDKHVSLLDKQMPSSGKRVNSSDYQPESSPYAFADIPIRKICYVHPGWTYKEVKDLDNLDNFLGKKIIPRQINIIPNLVCDAIESS